MSLEQTQMSDFLPKNKNLSSHLKWNFIYLAPNLLKIQQQCPVLAKLYVGPSTVSKVTQNEMKKLT